MNKRLQNYSAKVLHKWVLPYHNKSKSQFRTQHTQQSSIFLTHSHGLDVKSRHISWPGCIRDYRCNLQSDEKVLPPPTRSKKEEKSTCAPYNTLTHIYASISITQPFQAIIKFYVILEISNENQYIHTPNKIQICGCYTARGLTRYRQQSHFFKIENLINEKYWQLGAIRKWWSIWRRKRRCPWIMQTMLFFILFEWHRGFSTATIVWNL